MTILDTNTLIEIGNFISEKIADKNNEGSVLEITVDSLSFKKIDEDIFYRFRLEDSKEEYVPSDDEMILKFPNTSIKIVKGTEVKDVLWTQTVKQ